MARWPGRTRHAAHTCGLLGYMAQATGEMGEARHWSRESLALNVADLDEEGAPACLTALARRALDEGRVERAARVYGTVEAALEPHSISLVRVDQSAHERGTAAPAWAGVCPVTLNYLASVTGR